MTLNLSVVFKVDLKNAFNLVSRQALLIQVKNHFPELLSWACWCYGQHPLLWCTMGLKNAFNLVSRLNLEFSKGIY